MHHIFLTKFLRDTKFNIILFKFCTFFCIINNTHLLRLEMKVIATKAKILIYS